MYLRIRPWQLATLLIVLCAGAIVGVYYYRTRGGRSPADLISYLPNEDALVAWVDIGALRQSGILDMIGGSRVTEDAEYRAFVEQTGFNYGEDLEAVGISTRVNHSVPDKDVFAIARGTFDWKRLYAYARAHGGECGGAMCHVPTSHPGRYLSFYPLRSDLMALAVTSDQYGALLVGRRPGAKMTSVPAAPVWMLLSASALHSKGLFPEGTHAFATALEGADRVALSLSPSGDHLQLALDADCRSVDDASGLLVRLEQTTETLRRWIAREHQAANPGDLSGVLTAGTFRREDRRVLGAWPLQRPFVEAVVNGTAN